MPCSRRPPRRHALWRVLLALAAVTAAAAGMAQVALTDAQAKAVALINFARYVEWPERAFASREAPFTFCLAGRDSLAASAAALEGRTLHGRATVVRRVFGVDELRGCQLLYIAESEERRLAPMLRAVAGEPVLTVGDGTGFIFAGGAIGVGLDDGRIRFEISRPALDAAQLRASANLLRLARNIPQP